MKINWYLVAEWLPVLLAFIALGTCALVVTDVI